MHWADCVYCGKEMGQDEPRFRIEWGGAVGVGHKRCQDIAKGLTIGGRIY